MSRIGKLPVTIPAGVKVDIKPEAVFADEELLSRCGLEQPLLWKVAKVLQIPVPKSPEELAHYQIGRKTE